MVKRKTKSESAVKRSTMRPARSEKLWDNLSGFWSVWLIHMGCDLGLFEALRQGPMSAAELAARKGYEPLYVEVWCGAASSFGYLEGNATEGYRVTSAWAQLLEHYGDWASTYIRLSQRVYESLEAVFRGRAFPESVLSLRMAMSQGLKASYRNLWHDIAPKVPALIKRLQPNHRLIEYGCGFGLGLEMLRDNFPGLEVTGVEEDYDCAREAERSTRAVIIVGKPEEAHYSNRFDVALFHRSLSLCHEPFVALDRALEGLRPGGLLVVLSEGEIQQSGQLEPRGRIRLCERMFFQMFLSEHALRSISLKDLEDWGSRNQLEAVYRDPSPRRGSPCLMWAKP